MTYHVDIQRAWGMDFIKVCGNPSCDSQPGDIIFYTKEGGKNRSAKGAGSWDDQKVRQFCCKCKTPSNWMAFKAQDVVQRVFPKTQRDFYWVSYPVTATNENLIVRTVGIASKLKKSILDKGDKLTEADVSRGGDDRDDGRDPN
jgi:hypothetical protein